MTTSTPRRTPKKLPEGVDRLPSGKVRARTVGPDGKRRATTFESVADARAWLATQRADIVRRTWRAPEAGQRTVGSYAADYVARTDLRESTQDLYRGLWHRHLEDPFGDVPVVDVSAQVVRSWHAAASRTTKPTALAQSYRLLRSILNVAVADEVIVVNPCRLRSAGTPKPSRPSRALTTGEVIALSQSVPARYGALVLVLAFGGLRFGEATALRRRDFSKTGRGTVTVERSVRYVGGRWLVGDPKSEAGRRTVALPAFVAAAVDSHLDLHVADSPDAIVFGTASGHYLARQNFGATFRRAVQAVDLPPVRVHELRHTGATLAAGTPGTTTKELMRRLGHASPAAALIYQHAVDDRDADIARALDDVIATAPVVPIRAARRRRVAATTKPVRSRSAN